MAPSVAKVSSYETAVGHGCQKNIAMQASALLTEWGYLT